MEVHSISEGLEVTINLLNSIKLPVSQMREVGGKILSAVDNLTTIRMIIDAAQKEAEEKEEPSDGV